MKKVVLLMSFVIGLFLVSGCQQRSDFEKAVAILSKITTELEAYYVKNLTPGQLKFDEQQAFQTNDNHVYSFEEIRSSWIYDENTRLVHALKELERLKEIIDIQRFTSFEQINQYNAARNCFSSVCENDTGYYNFKYLGKDDIHFTFETSDGEWIESTAGYENIQLFKPHKMHVTHYYKIADSDNSYYYEFNEDQHILEFNYDHAQEILQYVAFTDLESFETFDYNLSTMHLPFSQTEIELSYVDYRKGTRIVWVIRNESLIEYKVYAHKSLITRSFIYSDLFYNNNDVLIAYNLANYDGWDRLEITEDHTVYQIYDENDQLIDFQLNSEDEERLYFQLLGDTAQLILEKTYDKDEITNDDVNLSLFGLSCFDDVINLEYINTYHEFPLIYEYDFYNDLMLKDLTINDLIVLIENSYVSYFIE
ncbi:MAG: hypothetical protein RBQ71_01875 [Acholeplasmataceae bacterium]|nr:hypothetical protein [Acholeplasmataceae bacterium]